MIDDKEYVMGLIKKQVEGTLTKEEYVEWKLAKLYHSEEDWFSMEVDVFCALEDASPETETEDWRPLFAKAQEREQQEKRRARRMSDRDRWVVAAVLLITLGWAIKYHWDVHFGPLERFGVCAQVADTLIPAWEFRGMVSAGTATSIRIEPGVEGHITRIGHVAVGRDPEGMLTISESTDSLASTADGYRDIRIATGPGEQLGVRLPDGTEVRLDGASALYYAYPADTAAAIRVTGQAYVKVTHRVNGRPVVMETANSLLRSEGGGFVVHAGDRSTVATLMEGQLVAVSRKDGRMQRAAERGDVIDVTTHDVQGGGPGLVSMRKSQGKAAAALQWALITVDYRNVSLEEFMALEGKRVGIVFGNLRCLSKSKRINAAMCYKATVQDFLTALGNEGIYAYNEKGIYTFCDPATGKPWVKGVKADDRLAEAEPCEECRNGNGGFRPLAEFLAIIHQTAHGLWLTARTAIAEKPVGFE